MTKVVIGDWLTPMTVSCHHRHKIKIVKNFNADMTMNGIGNSTASWAQFVRLTQTARERTGIDAARSQNTNATTFANAQANANANTNVSANTQNNIAGTNAVPFKRFADMYLSTSQNQTAQVAAQERSDMLNAHRKTVGWHFDAYA